MITVHLLLAGRALCGMEGIPRDWPHGHVWMSVEDYKADVPIKHDHIMCTECEQAERRLRHDGLGAV